MITMSSRLSISRRLTAFAAAWCILIACAQAAEQNGKPEKLSLASMFSDHMVLQRDMKVPIWGKAKPETAVTVQVGDSKQETTADSRGDWSVVVGPFKANAKPTELTVKSGDDTKTLSDVLVGEVWVASGQSNMEFHVDRVKDAEKELAAADAPEIRFIDVPNQYADEPLGAFKSDGWQVCKRDNIGSFSAVAYFFARNLHKELHVPIGLIGSSWGGTPMEAWTSREALNSSPTLRPMVAAADVKPKDDAEKAQRKKSAHNLPSRLFNGMISPIIPYAIRGVIWYQGEANAGRHQHYAELSKLMIADWRNRWGEGNFPFLLVQLAGYEPGGETWPPLREAQFETLKAPKVGMATAVDIGEQKDIHPRNKQEVGRRLALVAEAIAYGKKVEYSGPVYREMKADDGKVRVSFDHVTGGLEADGEVRGFEVAGSDGKYVPAKATIDGDEVVVSSDEVAKPQAVRYDWAAFPDGNLYNGEGLPALPFRSKKN
jgi:sialate O-acetylesterase